MQFQVPQFLDVQDTIFGPLTLRQFLYLCGAGAVSFITFFALVTWLWIAVTALVGMIAAGLAFGKFNGRPLIVMLFSAIKYAWQPKFYLWQYTQPASTTTLLAQKRQAPTGSPLQNLLGKLPFLKR